MEAPFRHAGATFLPALNISFLMTTRFEHAGPDSLRLGLVVAYGVRPSSAVPAMERSLEERLSRLASGLTDAEDAFRGLIRDVFRNGKYKPTGRAKPASEYLLRVASEGAFPRINTLVDICNTLSVASLLPISIWDLDKAETDRFIFRLGAVDESYVFNATGQDISLTDLIVGCAVRSDGSSEPIVNAVKDSQATKTDEDTARVAVALYAPHEDGPALSLAETCRLFETWLAATDPGCRTASSILEAGNAVELG